MLIEYALKLPVVDNIIWNLVVQTKIDRKLLVFDEIAINLDAWASIDLDE